MDPLLRLDDVAELLAVSVKTVEPAIASGDLACVRVGARALRTVHPDNLHAYIDKCPSAPKPASPRSVFPPARMRARREPGSFREQLRAVEDDSQPRAQTIDDVRRNRSSSASTRPLA